MLFDPVKASTGILRASELAKRKIPEDFFVLGPRFLPKGGRMALVGSTGIGKSWLCLNIVRSLITGTGMLGNSEWPTQKSKTLLIESEVGLTLGERISSVFADKPELMEDFYVLSQPEGFNLSHGSCAIWLKEMVRDMGFGTIILDPISDLADMDENSNREVRNVLSTLRDIQGPDVAAIFTHHTGKPPKDRDGYDPLDFNNARGASKFGDFVDTLVMMSRVPGKLVENHESWRMATSFEKTRHAKENPGRGYIHFNEHGNYRMEWRGGGLEEPERKRKSSPKWNSTPRYII